MYTADPSIHSGPSEREAKKVNSAKLHSIEQRRMDRTPRLHWKTEEDLSVFHPLPRGLLSCDPAIWRVEETHAESKREEKEAEVSYAIPPGLEVSGPIVIREELDPCVALRVELLPVPVTDLRV